MRSGKMQQMGRKKLYCSFAAGLVVVSVIIGFIWKGHGETKTIAEEISLVRTTVVGGTGAVNNFTYSGEVRGRYESQLAFQVNGKIIKRNVELGSIVRPGDVLMQIDGKDIQQTVNSNSAQVYSAGSQLRLAESNLQRYRQLYEQNAISQATLDQYENAYQVAVAGTRQASAQYSQGSNQLDYSTLYADKAGIVTSITAEAGQVVNAGNVVITIVQEGEREIEINVPENRIEEIRKTENLKVGFWALPTVSVDAKVREIAPMADKVTRTYKVRVSLLNPPAEVKLGMTATVTVLNQGNNQQSTIYIPLTAIYQNGNTPAVWVVKDSVLSLRTIKIGAFGDNKIQVVEGVNSGEIIVTAGVHKLREGQKVRMADGGPL